MRTIKLLIIGLLYSGNLIAQDCNAILFLNQNNVLEYTNYNKKGKAIAKSSHKTVSTSKQGSKIVATINIKSEDLKGKNSFESTYEASCENGVFSIDMARFFDNSKLIQYDDTDFNIDINGDILKFPVNMNVGDELNDGEIIIKVSNETLTLVTMTMNVTNRKILDKQTITTDAGTFDCQKVSFDFESKIGFLKVKGSGTEWYNADRVLVKSESFNKKGKSIGYTELTKIIE